MRIAVAEDSVLFREGLVRLLIDRGHDVVAAVGDGQPLLAAAAEQQPDLAIIDIRMPNSDGAETARELRRTQPDIGAVLLSQHVELRNCLDLIGTPRFGYLLKDRVLHLDDFADALTRVATGGIALDPLVVRALVRNHNTPTALTALSDRERQVLSLVAEGHSNTAVARTLTVSERTVEAHMRSIFTKLDLPDDEATNRRVRAVIVWLQAQP